MYHFDIPKTRQYDTGKIEVVARSSVGEAMASTELKIVQRKDDYRGVLKNSPRRKCSFHEFNTIQKNHHKHTNPSTIICTIKNKLTRNTTTISIGLLKLCLYVQDALFTKTKFRNLPILSYIKQCITKTPTSQQTLLSVFSTILPISSE